MISNISKILVLGDANKKIINGPNTIPLTL
jgi:hypothetical protein